MPMKAARLLYFAGMSIMGIGLFEGSLYASPSDSAKRFSRLVTLGGSVTETVHALGAGGLVVGTDLSSTFPAEISRLPKVGYHRAISSEGVLSLLPDLVIGTFDAGPPAAMTQLRAAGTALLILSAEPSVIGAKERILGIAKALRLEVRGQELVQTLDRDLERLRAVTAALKSRPKVLFIYARGQNVLSVAGRNNSADAMLGLAGGSNAVTGYEGFRPMTSEAVVAAAPDILLLPERGLESIGGLEGLLKMPGVALTPAGKNRRVLTMDDLLLLGFGPRLGQSAWELFRKLHPDFQG